MEKNIETNKIILPHNLQNEMIKFFLKTSIPKIAADKAEQQQQPPIKNDRGCNNG